MTGAHQAKASAPVFELQGEGLPEGWVGTTLGEVCHHPQYGWTTSAAKKVDGLKLLRTTDISSGEVDWRSVPECSAEPGDPEKYLLSRGDIVVSRAGSVGVSFLVEDYPRAIFASYLIRLRPRPPVLSEYVALFLKSPSYWSQITEDAAGIAVPNINATKLAAMPVPLPPLAEQKRIVAKAEELLARVNAARERLARVPAILKRFRQAVLAAACSGRLTADWRESRSGTGSAQELVDRVRAARKAVLRGTHSPTSIAPSREKAPERPNPDFQEEVPEGWIVVSMDELTTRITSGSRDWKRYYCNDGPGTFIMAQNIRPLRFDRSYRLAVKPPRNDRDRERSEAGQDDILVTIVGANTGDVCRIREDVKQHYVCQSVALMRPALPETSPFIELYLNSPHHGRLQYQNWIYGEGRPHLSFDHLRATAIALPPLDEQEDIVRRLGTLFRLADTIEARGAGGKWRAERLTQAILGKAFRGELVPTEADLARAEGRPYEPASALLARIRSSQAVEILSRKRARHASGTRGRWREA